MSLLDRDVAFTNESAPHFRLPNDDRSELLGRSTLRLQHESIELLPSGWLVSNNRDITLGAAVDGEGIVRIADLLGLDELRSGALVPVLSDWRMADAPPFNLLYGAHQRRNRRIRAVIDFLHKFFKELEAQSSANGAYRPVERPIWSKRRYRHASAVLRKPR